MTQTVHRSARIELRTTPAQRRRCLDLMVAAGDVWAMAVDCNRTLRPLGLAPIIGFAALCRELTGMSFGELPRHRGSRRGRRPPERQPDPAPAP
jgi:hypothetical protein